MFQTKIIGAALAASIVLVVSALGIRAAIDADLVRRAEAAVAQSTEAIQVAHRLHEASLLRFAEMVARAPEVVHAVQCPADEDGLRQARQEQSPLLDPATGQPVRDALGRMLDTEGRPIVQDQRPLCTRTHHASTLRYLRQLQESQRDIVESNAGRPLAERALHLTAGRLPDIFVVAGPDGTVIARLGHDRDNWFGANRPNMNSHRIVALADTHGAQNGFIAWRDADDESPRLVRAAVAPIYGPRIGDEAPFLGTVITGHLLTNDFAEEDVLLAQRHDVAYFQIIDGRVSLGGADFTRHNRLNTLLTGLSFASVESGEEGTFRDVVESPGTVFRAEVEGIDLRVASTRFASQDGDAPVAGAIVLMSPSETTRFTQRLVLLFPLLALAFFLLITVVTAATFRQMQRPIADISKGIQEVLAGNKDYMWPVEEDAYLADMAHQLNIMSAILQGKRAPDTDEEGENWGAMAAAEGGASQAGAPAAKPASVQGLGGLRARSSRKAEDEDANG